MMLFDFTSQPDSALPLGSALPLDPRRTAPPPLSLPERSSFGAAIDNSEAAIDSRARTLPTAADPIAADPSIPIATPKTIDLFADFDLAGLNAVLALGSSAPASTAIENDWLVFGL
jgi:hypothetical protein